MAVNAIFNFTAHNPPMALICGGILLLVVNPVTTQISKSMDYGGLGGILLVVGVGLQLVWMFKNRM